MRQGLAYASSRIQEQFISFLKVLRKGIELIATLLQFNTHCKGIASDWLESGLGLATPKARVSANITFLVQVRRLCRVTLLLEWCEDTLWAEGSCSIHFDWLILHLESFLVGMFILDRPLLDSLFHWFSKVDMLHHDIDVLVLCSRHAHWSHFLGCLQFFLCTCSIDVDDINGSLRLSKWDFEMVLA